MKIQVFSADTAAMLQGPSPRRGKCLKGVWSEAQFSKEHKTVGYWLIQPVEITKHQRGEGDLTPLRVTPSRGTEAL